MYEANNFAAITAVADAAHPEAAVTSILRTNKEILSGAKVTFHNKADADAVKDVTITNTQVFVGGVLKPALPAPGSGAASNGVTLRPGTYTITIEPVDAEANKLFNVGTPAVMEISFKLDISAIVPQSS